MLSRAVIRADRQRDFLHLSFRSWASTYLHVRSHQEALESSWCPRTERHALPPLWAKRHTAVADVHARVYLFGGHADLGAGLEGPLDFGPAGVVRSNFRHCHLHDLSLDLGKGYVTSKFDAGRSGHCGGHQRFGNRSEGFCAGGRIAQS